MKRAIMEGWVDTSLPDLPAGLDLDWLGSRLGYYRASELARQTTPSREEELRYLRQTADTLRLARKLLAPDELPPHGDATAFALASKAGVDWLALRRRLRVDLNQAQSMMRLSAAELEQQPGTGGRPKKHARTALLRAIVDKLRATPMKADPARVIAEQILTRCGVDVPLVKNDTRALRKAERRGQN